MEESRSTFTILTGKLTGRRPLGRPRRRWEENIRVHIKGMGMNTRNCLDSAQGKDYWRAVVMRIEPPGFINHGVSQLVITEL